MKKILAMLILIAIFAFLSQKSFGLVQPEGLWIIYNMYPGPEATPIKAPFDMVINIQSEYPPITLDFSIVSENNTETFENINCRSEKSVYNWTDFYCDVHIDPRKHYGKTKLIARAKDSRGVVALEESEYYSITGEEIAKKQATIKSQTQKKIFELELKEYGGDVFYYPGATKVSGVMNFGIDHRSSGSGTTFNITAESKNYTEIIEPRDCFTYWKNLEDEVNLIFSESCSFVIDTRKHSGILKIEIIAFDQTLSETATAERAYIVANEEKIVEKNFTFQFLDSKTKKSIPFVSLSYGPKSLETGTVNYYSWAQLRSDEEGKLWFVLSSRTAQYGFLARALGYTEKTFAIDTTKDNVVQIIYLEPLKSKRPAVPFEN